MREGWKLLRHAEQSGAAFAALIWQKVYCDCSVGVKQFSGAGVYFHLSACFLKTGIYRAQLKNQEMLAYFFIPVLQTPSAVLLLEKTLSHILEAQPFEMAFKEKLGCFVFICILAPL